MASPRSLLLLLLLLPALLHCSADALLSPPTARVLFVGNSYVYFNELDQIYSSMATAAQPLRIEAGRVAKPNYWLRQHAADDSSVWEEFRARKAAGTPWTLVLQEQSQTPGLPEGAHERAASEVACRKLAASAAACGATCIVMMQTWGRRDGDDEYAEIFGSFADMQARLAAGYEALAAAVRDEVDSATSGVEVLIAPCGSAFDACRSGDASLFDSLYADDGAHPALCGSYLAACALVHTLHGELPEDGSDEGGGASIFVPAQLDARTARQLRDAARRTVAR